MNHVIPYELFESKQVGVLYHFTNFDCLLDILKEGELVTTCDTFTDDFISTTRRFDFKWGECRLTLDGNRLSERYRIEPIHYFNQRHGSYIDDYRATGDVGKGDMVKHLPMNQYEERILSGKNVPIAPYLLSIDIVIPDDFHDDSTRYGYPPDYSKQCRKNYKSILALAKKQGLKVNTVEKFTPFRATAV